MVTQSMHDTHCTAIVFQVHHLGDFGPDGDRATCGEHSSHRVSQNSSMSTMECVNKIAIFEKWDETQCMTRMVCNT